MRRRTGWILVCCVFALGGLTAWLIGGDPTFVSSDGDWDEAASEQGSAASLRGSEQHKIALVGNDRAPAGVGGVTRADVDSDESRESEEKVAHELIVIEDGKPVAGVRFVVWSDDASPRPELDIVTDSTGKAAFDCSSTNPQLMVQTREKYISEYTMENTVPRVHRITLAGGIALVVRVVDAKTSRGIAGARVECSPERGGDWIGRTDQRGEVTVPAVPPDGPIYLWTHPAGYREAEGAVQATGGKLSESSIELTCEPAAQIGGVVLDSRGQPVEGALVLVGDLGNWVRWQDFCEQTKGKSWGPDEVPQQVMRSGRIWGYESVRTDEEGRFRVDALDRSRRVVVGAHYRGGRALATDGISLDAPTSEIVLKTSDAGRLEATITDSRGQRVSEGGFLRIRGGMLHGRLVPINDGLCNLERMPAGSYVLHAEIHGYRSDVVRVDITPNNESRVSVRVRKGLVISGVVMDSAGKRLASAHISAVRIGRDGKGLPSHVADSTFSIRSDVWGSFELVGLPAGTYQLEAESDRRAKVRLRTASAVRVQAPRDDVQLELVPSGRIRVLIVRASGDPIEGAVEVELDGPLHVASTEQLVEGKLTLEGLASGTYEIRITAAGLAPATLTRDLALGQDLDAGRLVIQDGARIDVRIVTEQGDPIPLVDVGVANRIGTGMQTDSKGRYLTTPIVRGPVSIMTSMEGFENRDLVFDSRNGTKLIIPLRRTHPHRGRVELGGRDRWPAGTRLAVSAPPLSRPVGCTEEFDRERSARLSAEGRFGIELGHGRWRAKLLVPTAGAASPTVIELGDWIVGDAASEGKIFTPQAR